MSLLARFLERLISMAFFVKAMLFYETEIIFFAVPICFTLFSFHVVSRTASEGLLLHFHYTPAF